MVQLWYVEQLRLEHMTQEALLEAQLHAQKKLNNKLLWALGIQTILIVAFILVYVV